MLHPSIVALTVLLTVVAAESALAQNVLGAEKAPVSTVEVQRQIEIERRELDDSARRNIPCEQTRAREERSFPSRPPSLAGEVPVTSCAR